MSYKRDSTEEIANNWLRAFLNTASDFLTNVESKTRFVLGCNIQNPPSPRKSLLPSKPRNTPHQQNEKKKKIGCITDETKNTLPHQETTGKNTLHH